MWLNRLFLDVPVDFERRCRNRLRVGMGVTLLGVLSLAAMVLQNRQIMVLYLEPGAGEFIPAFYGSLGIGLMAGGLANVMRNRRYLSDPKLRREREVAENDERNRLLGLRCWAYAGYTMFLALYVGILACGFVSVTAAKVLMVVGGVYALLLLLFRILLSRAM